MNKVALRKHIRHLKKQHSKGVCAEQSAQISEHLLREIRLNKNKCVLVYWSLNDEVDTHKLVEELLSLATVLLPVVKGSDLLVKEYQGIDKMIQVPPYGIFEPQGEEFTDFDLIDLAIIPGMAFDKDGNRLGRGKAFYDGLLPKLKCKKIGICYDFQRIERIPVEPHDIQMDEVISG